ncbi:MAG: cytochrome c peroxidase [Saprospiraceae bacterium]|nr:cytochrome c peroxidase [Saprospiraceae bacterium]
MKKLQIGLFLLLGVGLVMQSCKDNIADSFHDYTDDEYEIISQKLNLPIEVFEYSSDQNVLIDDFGEQHIPNRRDNHKATLGRVLFYDTKLSINESISCASCHKQDLAFADDVAFSEGFNGELTTRNSLPLGNTIGFEMAYGGPRGSLFAWDESNEDIASQSKAAIISEIEMGLDMDELVDRIEEDEVYSILFSKSYGDSDIFQHRILEAIEEFVNSIVSNESKFDHETADIGGDVFKTFPGFTEAENKGKTIYFQKCATCHSFDHKLTAKAVANNGLDVEYEDKGLGGRTLNAHDNGVFKVPFLRNIELTAPYMHDGRFATIREVINHYSEGIANHPNLDLQLIENNQPKQMNFTEDEKVALEAYLKTLTDKVLMTEVKFSDPFKI